MTNRTFSPIPFGAVESLNAEKEENKGLRVAYLGDENGRVPVTANGNSTDHYGKVYIRFQGNPDSTGATTYTQAVEAYVNPNANMTYKTNLPVLVYFDRPTQTWVVDRVDVVRANKANYNTLVLNPKSPSSELKWERQLQDAKLFAPATTASDSLTISVQPFIFVFNGQIYSGGKENNIDLTSYMPGAGLERLVILGERAYDRTIQVVSSATRSQTTDKYALSDIDTLVSQFDDYIIPLGAVKLANAATTILERDLHQNLVQRVNVPEPRGFPNPVTRHRYIVDGYQEHVHGKVYITSGKLHLAGKLVARD